MNRLLAIGLAALLAMPTMAAAQGTLADQENARQGASVLAQAKAAYNSIPAFACDYLRISQAMVLAQSGGQAGPQEASGEMYFSRPAKVRLRQYRPKKEEIIINPQGVWWHRLALKEAHYYPPNQFESTMKPILDFFSGVEELAKNYKVSRHKDWDQEDGRAVVLIPKNPQGDIERMVAWVNKDGFINQLSLYTLLGDKTTYQFHDIEVLKKAPAALYEFKPPKDYRVVKH